jgi:hypothetical protein
MDCRLDEEKWQIVFFGCKNHVAADVEHKAIRAYQMTDAAVDDSQVLEYLLTYNIIN